MASTAMESIRLWLALTPKQFEDLNNGKEIQPDEYSKRFGLRKDPVAAVERAQYFNDWTPEGPKGEFCAKDYVLVEVEVTAIGYLQKAEAGVLLKYKPNEYRWQGTMKSVEFDQYGNLLLGLASVVCLQGWGFAVLVCVCAGCLQGSGLGCLYNLHFQLAQP